MHFEFMKSMQQKKSQSSCLKIEILGAINLGSLNRVAGMARSGGLWWFYC
jgi:hypothetical protein